MLRALQAHDGRLAESPANFIQVYEQTKAKAPGDPESGAVRGTAGEHVQRELDLKEAEQGIYDHIAAAGLGKPGQLVADEIADAVRRASAALQDEEMEGPLAEALDLVPENTARSKGTGAAVRDRQRGPRGGSRRQAETDLMNCFQTENVG